MISNLTKTNFQDIIHHLMIKGAMTKDIGLLDGKMGVVIAFYELARKYDNEVYRMYADELLDQVFEAIYVKTPIDFESGLVGIGWGLEYLIQNKYVEADSLDICEVIDSQLMNIDIRRVQDCSIEKGLDGFLRYTLAHISNCLNQSNKLPFDAMYLSDLNCKLTQINEKEDILFSKLIGKYLLFFRTKKLEYALSLSEILEPMHEIDMDKLRTYPIGIRKGLVAHVLSNMKL